MADKHENDALIAGSTEKVSDSVNTESKRIRTLTEKGHEQYESTKDTHADKLQCLEKRLNVHLQECNTSPQVDTVIKLRELKALFGNFEEKARSYIDFLSRTNTEESLQEMKSLQLKYDSKEKQYDEALIQLQEALETVSRSHKSSMSNTSSLAARIRAKAEASKVRLEFTKKECELARKKAECDAELHLLTQEKEVAALETEAMILEQIAEQEEGKLSVSSDKEHNRHEVLRLPKENSNAKTQRYVDSLAQSMNNANQNAACLQPQPAIYPQFGMQSTGNDFSKFLLKKDLLLSRLTYFDEQPQSFEVWRNSFLKVMEELEVSSEEELDLLVKYLGPESTKYAISLRSSHPLSPEKGLQLLWERLDERFGSPELVESCLKAKIDKFPQLTYKDTKRYYELCDLLEEINSAKENPKLRALLSVYDSSLGVNAIVTKLPPSFRQKWITKAAAYKEEHAVPFPPFSVLLNFMKNLSKIQNDPAFSFARENEKRDPPKDRKQIRLSVVNRKAEVDENEDDTSPPAQMKCPIHKTQHPLSICKAFAAKVLADRTAFLKENRICFKCLTSSQHVAKNCPAKVKCEKCGKGHHTIMHREAETQDQQVQQHNIAYSSSPPSHGGEKSGTKCTLVCGSPYASRSCGKIVKVKVFKKNQPSKKVEVYAVLDDQSNRSLATPALLDKLGTSQEQFAYTLTSCSGTQAMSGRRADDLCIQSLDSERTMKLPTLIECESIPDDRSEIPTPEVTQHHRHLSKIAKFISPLDPEARIGMLIGRDLPEAHHVLEQVTGPSMAPFAQKLTFGWVIIGDVCLDGKHKPHSVSVSKTCVDQRERESILDPCPNRLKIREADEIAPDVFQRTPQDEEVGTSVEDRKFLVLMNEKFRKNEEGRWTAPLPLKSTALNVNNRSQAFKRAQGLHASMKRDSTKREHMFKFMSKIFDTGSAEKAPQLKESENRWYLPFFGVYHPRKPDKIRGVFDSSAVYEGISLNSMLYSGPDLTNSLLGILMRFRRDTYAVTADIEQMFYQFFVDENHRDYLRFFWYEDNDFDKPLVEYRMCVHVFGNSPSPAVATYGLRKAVAASNDEVRNFVNSEFYVDDGVASRPQREQAVSLMQQTITDLMENGKIRLHKIASNDRDILKAFSVSDLWDDLKSQNFLDPSVPLPVHSCLGLRWNLDTDSFEVSLQLDNKPFTRRGILSIINSIYDPLGFIAPAVITGKILLREISGGAWDVPIPSENLQVWEQWMHSLKPLQGLEVPRQYVPSSLSKEPDAEFHIFCDASEKAISAVAYVKEPKPSAAPPSLGFVIGKAKVAPSGGHTIPRLELCSAVLAADLWQMISTQMNLDPCQVTFHTDSKVVLGYINNETRRFYTYVSNRVERIRHISKPSQWKYVPTDENPADLATRCVQEDVRQKVIDWLHGPSQFLESERECIPASPDEFPLVSPNADVEIRSCVKKTEVVNTLPLPPLSSRFAKFSSWSILVRSLCLLRHICQSSKNPSLSCSGWHWCRQNRTVKSLKATERFIIRTVQSEAFALEIQCLRKGNVLPKCSTILSLHPCLDENGLLRVGGRLSKAENMLGVQSVHPLILPKNHHVSSLLVQHFHQKVKHQGRHLTEGALRSEGFWVVGAKRLVSSVIHRCFLCRRLRGKPAHQLMADLPEDRVLPTAPFSHVGVDVFGPWNVAARKTRGGVSNSKRWAVIFVCMATRAIHIELIEEMSSASFINALRRFIALRGPVTELRSDRGTNFIGAASELGMNSLFVENGPVQKHLLKANIIWRFNPPHASHMGGSWERMIGVVRRVLDALLLDARRKALTHEVLSTFMSEVCAIVNSRPIAPISYDADSPLVLTPSMLLTMKTGQNCSPFESCNLKDTYKNYWKHVQVLSNTFWKRWRDGYLQSLQQRRKWKNQVPNLKEGDLVLLKDNAAHRINWPLGLVTRTFPSDHDTLVRSVEVRVMKDKKPVCYIRPVSELVPL